MLFTVAVAIVRPARQLHLAHGEARFTARTAPTANRDDYPPGVMLAITREFEALLG